MDRLRRFPFRATAAVTGLITLLLVLHFVVQVNLLPLNTDKTRWTEQSVRKYTWLPKADYDM